MRRKSRPRVVWLPPTDANSVGGPGAPEPFSNIQVFGVDVSGPAGSTAVGEIPLVIDEAADPEGLTTSLSDVTASGYRLRRIVGKIFVLQKQNGAQEVGAALATPPLVMVTAGFMVRRTDEASQLSLALALGQEINLHPTTIGNMSDPWIWRRSWLVGDNSSSAKLVTDVTYPTTNWGPEGPCGGNIDGPHVDQKTARVVAQEERLFLTVGVTIVDAGGDPQLLATTQILTDLRVLASMTTSTGNRNNSSR